MIYVGIGSNLPGPGSRSLRGNCAAALDALQAAGVGIAQRSRWYRSAPEPPSDQPWFVNGVVAIEPSDAIHPEPFLELLHEIELDFGRRRGERNAARTLDLDILDFDGQVSTGDTLVLPHPRLHLRAFVLLPLSEIAPDWHHPATGRPIFDLISDLPPGQVAKPIA